jgi:hypothetical protein
MEAQKQFLPQMNRIINLQSITKDRRNIFQSLTLNKQDITHLRKPVITCEYNFWKLSRKSLYE